MPRKAGQYFLCTRLICLATAPVEKKTVRARVNIPEQSTGLKMQHEISSKLTNGGEKILSQISVLEQVSQLALWF
jgi:phage baseplate assembly protein gpV